MNCPRCGAEMTQGAPHADGDAYQYECHRCGNIVRPYEENQARRIANEKRPYDCDHS